MPCSVGSWTTTYKEATGHIRRRGQDLSQLPFETASKLWEINQPFSLQTPRKIPIRPFLCRHYAVTCRERNTCGRYRKQESVNIRNVFSPKRTHFIIVAHEDVLHAQRVTEGCAKRKKVIYHQNEPICHSKGLVEKVPFGVIASDSAAAESAAISYCVSHNELRLPRSVRRGGYLAMTVPWVYQHSQAGGDT